MGLMDVLNGMQNGPRGARHNTGGTSGGGMSPLTMALIGLLAFKAIKHFTGGQPAQQTAPAGGRGAAPTPPAGGSLADVLKNGLGGLLGGAAAGGVLSGGLSDILKQLEQSGHGDVAKSWVGTGPNKAISPQDLEKALGTEQVNTLAQQAGLSKVALLDGLSDQLPELVDQLTPEGRVPTEAEASRLV
ncbi:MAG: DUF937 domain-containing protein [Xanthobacteraceae bacterium]|nr:DUF937 domain-containing protein [Xanthobacteraceae bacterium]